MSVTTITPPKRPLAHPPVTGHRWVTVASTAGETGLQVIPVSLDDYLNRRFNDKMTQSIKYSQRFNNLYDTSDDFFANQSDAFVTQDGKLFDQIVAWQEVAA